MRLNLSVNTGLAQRAREADCLESGKTSLPTLQPRFMAETGSRKGVPLVDIDLHDGLHENQLPNPNVYGSRGASLLHYTS